MTAICRSGWRRVKQNILSYQSRQTPLHQHLVAKECLVKQFFHHHGQRYGHVIDPRSGYPAGDLLSLTVLMESAADADACATGMFVMGSDAIGQMSAEDWLPTMITVRPASRQDAVEVQCMGDVRWVDDPPDEVSQAGREDD